MIKPLRIFVSNLTSPPRYYAACAYREDVAHGRIIITGKKWDVTKEIEAIVQERMAQNVQDIAKEYADRWFSFRPKNRTREALENLVCYAIEKAWRLYDMAGEADQEV